MFDPEIDLGSRCDRHIGEAFRVRCQDCDNAQVDNAPAPLPRLDRNPPLERLLRQRPKDEDRHEATLINLELDINDEGATNE